MKMKRLIRMTGMVFFVCYMALPALSYSEVIFQDNFDNHTDWTRPQPAKGASNDICNDCGTEPEGWNGYYNADSEYTPVGRNTISINATQHRGPTGKAFIFWSEAMIGSSWASNGTLVKKLDQEYDELYVRFYMKYQSDYKYANNSSVAEKIFRITHHSGGTSGGQDNPCTGSRRRRQRQRP